MHRAFDRGIKSANETMPKQIGDGGEQADLRVAKLPSNGMRVAT
jgi:hypothetical protein